MTLTEEGKALIGEEAVWRVCHALRTADGKPCDRCPMRETIHSEAYMRGCYLQASQIVNIVETGNPWRRTENVKAPWVALSAAPTPGREDINTVEEFCRRAEKTINGDRGCDGEEGRFADVMMWEDEVAAILALFGIRQPGDGGT